MGMTDTVVKVEVDVTRYIPPSNEPWKSVTQCITMITKRYADGGFDEFFPPMVGIKADDEFYDEIPSDCELVIKVTNRIGFDKYYTLMGCSSFKAVCYDQKDKVENPYQLPKFTTL